MKIVKVPEGQSEKSFRKVKINDIKRTIEIFGPVLDDNECFESEFQINVIALQLQLQSLLDKLKEN
jgi:hypothetical protein